MKRKDRGARTAAARKAARFRWRKDGHRKYTSWMNDIVRGLDPAAGVENWVKLDNRWRDNPKVIAAGPDGELLWLHAIGYADYWYEQCRGGRVPKTVIPLLVTGFSHQRSGRAYASAVKAGLLVDDGSGVFEIHDYAEYQQTPEQKEAAKQASVAGGKARAEQAVRDKGKFIPASNQPSDQPTAGQANPDVNRE